MDSEKRCEERYRLRKTVTVATSSNHSEKPDTYPSRNISSKGIFIELDGFEGFEIGQPVQLEIDLGKLNGGDKPVQVMTKGRVLRCEADGVVILFNGRSNLVQK